MDGFFIGLVGSIIGLIFLARLMIKTKFWKQLTSPEVQKKINGFSNSFGWESFKGKDGIADTDLHPSGWIREENERVFVVSEGDFIEKGAKINVLSVDGNRIVVRELKK